MDKKKQMPFNLNNFLLAMSIALDFKQKDKNNTTLNHYKRVAFMSLKLALKYNLEAKELSDLCSLSLVYDLEKKDLEKLPFLNERKSIDNSLFLEIISLASLLDKKFSLGIDNIENRVSAINFVKNEANFSKDLIENFLDISKQVGFWLDLQNENDILMFIYSSLEDFTTILDFEEILKITEVFHKIVNPDSIFIEMCEKITDKYDFEHKDKQTFLIAASLQNIGKLVISSVILNKKEKLTENEYEIIKSYPYYTKKILNNIMGFADICIWASKVQERIDGSGYPSGLSSKDLSLKDRLMFTLSIYCALTEDKAYRIAYVHDEAIEIMKKEADIGKLDMALVSNFDSIFK
jgi:response regulator RpfG family c-di-GMP phosphodiesterase